TRRSSDLFTSEVISGSTHTKLRDSARFMGYKRAAYRAICVLGDAANRKFGDFVRNKWGLAAYWPNVLLAGHLNFLLIAYSKALLQPEPQRLPFPIGQHLGKAQEYGAYSLRALSCKPE